MHELENDLQRFQSSYLWEDCCLLGIAFEPAVLVLKVDLRLPVDGLVWREGELRVCGVERVQFNLLQPVCAGAEAELDFGDFHFHSKEYGLDVHCNAGVIEVFGAKIRLELPIID